MFDSGAENLSHEEILAILIGSGSRGEDAVALAIRLLAGLWEGLPALASASGDTLLAMRGLGPAKVSAILAAVELGKRLFRQKEAAPPSPDT
ncbi:MAG: hypothetical protein INR69_18815 [Mucilaginibacter polytrichastri]|nr:hypothetical protein [Mucilaginibacter polytrichastri]